jgi:hypothetical protein
MSIVIRTFPKNDVQNQEKSGMPMSEKEVAAFLLSDDQQGHVGNDIEDQKDNFEQPEK